MLLTRLLPPPLQSANSALEVFGNILLFWRNGKLVQDAYSEGEFPFIERTPVAPISIGFYDLSNTTTATLDSVVSFGSPTSAPSPSPSIVLFADHMDVDTPELTVKEKIDERLDVVSLAANFTTLTLRTYFKSAFSFRNNFPVLMHIAEDAQTLLMGMMFMKYSHGAWKDNRGADFDHYRPTEAQITLIAFQTAYIFHHRLHSKGMATVFNSIAEICSMKAFVSLHFLTESRIHRNHQRLLTMVRTILGQYMGVGWHVFRTAKGVPNTAGSLLDGLTQLATEIEVFMQEPMKAYKGGDSLLVGPVHLAIIFIYKQFFNNNVDGKKSISKMMKSLRDRWGAVWETQGVPGYTWVIDGVRREFNHKSLDYGRLPFLDYNPTDPYSLILVMLGCVVGEGLAMFKQIPSATIIPADLNIFERTTRDQGIKYKIIRGDLQKHRGIYHDLVKHLKEKKNRPFITLVQVELDALLTQNTFYSDAEDLGV